MNPNFYKIPDARSRQLSMPVFYRMASIYCATPQTSIEVFDLPEDPDAIYELVFCFHNETGSTAEVDMYINGDYTEASFDGQSMLGNGATASGSRAGSLGPCQILTATCSVGWIDLFVDPQGNFRYNSHANINTSAAIECELRYCVKTTIRSTTIRSIRLTASVANAFGIGSWVRIYKKYALGPMFGAYG